LAMAERGQITRILAPKYGGFLTFGALSPERASAPGQPTLAQLRELYRLPTQNSSTRVFGIVGNPVSHSKSPAIHNAAMGDAGFDGVYVRLLVDDMQVLLDSLRDEWDWAGLSVTIPHKEAALRGAASSDEVAASIGAANTLVRQADGSFKAYNTDWSAAISAIERGMDGSGRSEDATSSPLRNTTVVVVGAGGAGRALAFGALSRGAEVIVANRTVGKAEELAAALGPGARGVALSAVASGEVSGDVLVNTTSVGMHPKDNETPVPASALGKYKVVFDAVYTPLHTRLLKEAASFGCTIVTGDEMFVGQAADQFRLFTGLEPPVELMRQVVLGK
jgi:3-dehydroquinate dehydratase / shikimate dehydrogenase